MTDPVPLAVAAVAASVVGTAWIVVSTVMYCRRLSRHRREHHAACAEGIAAAENALRLQAAGREAEARFAWRQYYGRVAMSEESLRRMFGEDADAMLAQIKAEAQGGPAHD